MVVGQIVWALVVAVFLMAVAVGWAMRGAMEVRQTVAPPRQRRRIATVRPEILKLISGRKQIFASAFLLAFALLFFARSMGREFPLLEAVVLSFAYALACGMITGFIVWTRAQREPDDEDAMARPELFRWAAWVGVGVGAVAITYLVGNLVTSLT